jgi:hypothetical protein
MQSDICTSCASNGIRRVFIAAKADNDYDDEHDKKASHRGAEGTKELGMIEKKKRKKEEKEKPITSTVWAKALTEHEHEFEGERGLIKETKKI